MAPHVFFVLFNSNHQVALRIDGTAAICISIEVRDRAATVWRRCSVAVDVDVDRWRCRPEVEGICLLGRFIKNKTKFYPKNILSGLFDN